jgi:signal transduction histidine kinase
VLIEVEDEGSGVQEEALARIFERFARTDAARARSTGGVGLGLSIVDAIAKAHGGRCTAQNTGHGSIFSLQLPGATPSHAPQELPELSSSSTLAPMRPA